MRPWTWCRPEHFTLLHVTPVDVSGAIHGAYAELLGRAGRDPGTRLERMAATSAAELLEAAAPG